MGPIPHHMHQNDKQAALVGQEGKPESYYFPPQLNAIGNNFPYTFFGLEPGTTKDDIIRCLERWNEGDNGILNYSKAYRLQPGTGWLVPPCVLHAPGLAGHLRAAVGLRRVRHVPVAGRRPARAVGAAGQGLARRKSTTTSITWSSSSTGKATSIRTSRTTITSNRSRRRHRAARATSIAGSSTARWTASSCSRAKELTVNPGVKVTIKDNGAYGLIAVQGSGRIGKHAPADAGHDPLRRIDRGRSLRDATRRPRRA